MDPFTDGVSAPDLDLAEAAIDLLGIGIGTVEPSVAGGEEDGALILQLVEARLLIYVSGRHGRLSVLAS